MLFINGSVDRQKIPKLNTGTPTLDVGGNSLLLQKLLMRTGINRRQYFMSTFIDVSLNTAIYLELQRYLIPALVISDNPIYDRHDDAPTHYSATL